MAEMIIQLPQLLSLVLPAAGLPFDYFGHHAAHDVHVALAACREARPLLLWRVLLLWRRPRGTGAAHRPRARCPVMRGQSFCARAIAVQTPDGGARGCADNNNNIDINVLFNLCYHR